MPATAVYSEAGIDRLPQETLVQIFEWVQYRDPGTPSEETFEQEQPDSDSLLKCSLVRKAWVGPARAVHFRHITLDTGDTEEPNEKLERFSQLLDPVNHNHGWGLAKLVLHLTLCVTEIMGADKRKWFALKQGLDEKAIGCWTRAVSHLPNLRELSFRSDYWTERLIPYLRATNGSPSAQFGTIRKLRLYSLGEARIMGCLSSDLTFLATLEDLVIDSFIGSIGRLLQKTKHDGQYGEPLLPQLQRLELDGISIEDDNFRDLMAATSNQLEELSVVNTLVSAGCFLDVLRDGNIRFLTIWQNEDAASTLLEEEAIEALGSDVTDSKALDRVSLFPFDSMVARLPSLAYLSLDGRAFSGDILRALPPTIVVLYLTDFMDVSRHDVFDLLDGLSDLKGLRKLKFLELEISGRHQHDSWRDEAWIKSLEEANPARNQSGTPPRQADDSDSTSQSQSSDSQDVRVSALEKAAREGPLGSQLRKALFTIERWDNRSNSDSSLDLP